MVKANSVLQALFILIYILYVTVCNTEASTVDGFPTEVKMLLPFEKELLLQQ